jgi:hypothetical protein
MMEGKGEEERTRKNAWREKEARPYSSFSRIMANVIIHIHKYSRLPTQRNCSRHFHFRETV